MTAACADELESHRLLRVGKAGVQIFANVEAQDGPSKQDSSRVVQDYAISIGSSGDHYELTTNTNLVMTTQTQHQLLTLR